MGDFQKDLLKEVANRRKGQDLADAVGMPDQQDYEVLIRIIQRFKRTTFPIEVSGKLVYVSGAALIQNSLAMARHDYHRGIHGKNKHSLVNKQSGTRYALELPGDLYRAIETIFPTMFRSKKHLRWFCKMFPELTVSGKPL